jgi:hypothetical protein
MLNCDISNATRDRDRMLASLLKEKMERDV